MDKTTRDYLDARFESLNQKIDLTIKPVAEKCEANEKRSNRNSQYLNYLIGVISFIGGGSAIITAVVKYFKS